MKRLLLLLLPALLLAGCAKQEPTTDATAIDLGNAVAESQPEEFSQGLIPLSTDPELGTSEELETYLLTAYGLERSDWTDAAAAYSQGFQANELAVIQLADGIDAGAAENQLVNYLENRRADFMGYAPEEAAMLEDALLLRRGRWLLLAVCPDPEGALDAFMTCFEGNTSQTQQVVRPYTEERDSRGYVVFDPPNQEEMPLYDTGPVVEAWRTGDSSALSEQDAAILEVCRQALEEMLRDGMTPAEQELAVHDWIIDHAAYDESHTFPNRSHPYGLLVEGQAICMGYANTFQLFMDLLDIPCVTVIGASGGSREDHAWNLVQLDGDWYAVDTTWDDPLGSYVGVPAANEKEHHRYFNVTSDFLRQTDHQWDYDAVQEATGTRWTWSVLRTSHRT